MSDAFVPLGAFLRSAREPEPLPLRDDALHPAPAAVATPAELQEALREARCFRAGLADAIDAALPDVLEGIARQVLARELQLEGAAIAVLVESALDGSCAGVLRVCVHPSDLGALREGELERVADAALQPGDVRLELRTGTIDLSLRARLDALLAAWR